MRAVVEATLWTGACLGVWLLTLSSVTLPDLLLAAVSAAGCGAAALGGRWAASAPAPVRAGALPWLARLPVSLLADLVTVLLVPWQLLAGRTAAPATLRCAVLPGGQITPTVDDKPATDTPGPDARAFYRRALAGTLVSMTPGTVALETDPASGELTVHSLTGSRSRLERRIAPRECG